MRVCPGKDVLKKLRAIAQKDWKVTLTNTVLVNALTNLPEDLAEISSELRSFFGL